MSLSNFYYHYHPFINKINNPQLFFKIFVTFQIDVKINFMEIVMLLDDCWVDFNLFMWCWLLIVVGFGVVSSQPSDLRVAVELLLNLIVVIITRHWLIEIRRRLVSWYKLKTTTLKYSRLNEISWCLL
jgi:hypothetical protein